MSTIMFREGGEVTHEPMHAYTSTACVHGFHDYCKNERGWNGLKKPTRCKFCQASCRCKCHKEGKQA